MVRKTKNIKRITSLYLFMLVLALAAFLAGCGRTYEAERPNGRLKVIATIFAPYDFAREIASGMADVSMLLPPAAETHSFEPSPQDMMDILNCDVFIYVGGESDVWVDGVLASLEASGVRVVTLMDCVEPLEEELVEGMEDGEDEGDEGDAYDEHIWTSPGNAKLIVQKISDALREADDANAPLYQQNADAYLEKLDELDASFRDAVDSAARKTIVFGDRFPFRYLADAYGLEYFAAFPGCASETEPSAATVAFLIKKIKDEKIPVVFRTELSNGKMADAISADTGAKVLVLHSCHNISKDDFENGASYLELNRRNLEALREALG